MKSAKTFYLAMGAYWMVFGLITTFVPSLMDLFQTVVGVQAKSPFSNHVWFHGGLDILALCAVLFGLSTQPPNRVLLRATAAAALCPTVAILYSLIATPYWAPIFAGAGVGCFGFAVWGWKLSSLQD